MCGTACSLGCIVSCGLELCQCHGCTAGSRWGSGIAAFCVGIVGWCWVPNNVKMQQLLRPRAGCTLAVAMFSKWHCVLVTLVLGSGNFLAWCFFFFFFWNIAAMWTSGSSWYCAQSPWGLWGSPVARMVGNGGCWGFPAYFFPIVGSPSFFWASPGWVLHFPLYAAILTFCASESCCFFLPRLRCPLLGTLLKVQLFVVLVLCGGSECWAPLVSHLDNFIDQESGVWQHLAVLRCLGIGSILNLLAYTVCQITEELVVNNTYIQRRCISSSVILLM